MRLVALAFLTACGGASAASTSPASPPPPPDASPAPTYAGVVTAKRLEFTEQMCTCEDVRCGDDVDARMTTWGQNKAMEKGSEALVPTDEDRVQAEQIASRYAQCRSNLSAVTDPTTPLGKMTAWANEMCACTSKACGEDVQARMAIWSDEMARLARPSAPRAPATTRAPSNAEPAPATETKSSLRMPDDETMKKMNAIGQRYGECYTKALAAP